MHAFPEKYSKPSLTSLAGAEGMGWSATCNTGGGPGTDPNCSAGPSTPNTICVFLSPINCSAGPSTPNTVCVFLSSGSGSGGFLTPGRVGSGL